MRKRKITQNNLSEPSRKLHRKSVSFAENLENIPPVTVQDGENVGFFLLHLIVYG